MRKFSNQTRHGMSRTKPYAAWQQMKERCLNSNSKSYKYYGGRGITVCKEWKDSFENFYKDMGDRPIKMTIDRIDNDGNYCKENCRWATINQQNNNRSTNNPITFRGKTLNITAWSRHVGKPLSTIINRINRGWEIEKVLFYTTKTKKWK